MTTPEEKYYDSMNTLLAPVRWVKSLLQTVLLLVTVVVIGLAYPAIVYSNHEPMTFATFAVSLLPLLAIFTFFYAPYYLIFGGMVFLAGWGVWIIIFDAPNRAQTLWLWFAFLAIGILQRHIRHRLYNQPKPRQLSFVAQLNQVRRERRTREYDAMSPDEREAITRLYGDNYLTWPE